ncbi:MAG: hypothetical protein ABJC19_04750 [Gemmatimonadota bacterium]
MGLTELVLIAFPGLFGIAFIVALVRRVRRRRGVPRDSTTEFFKAVRDPEPKE